MEVQRGLGRATTSDTLHVRRALYITQPHDRAVWITAQSLSTSPTTLATLTGNLNAFLTGHEIPCEKAVFLTKIYPPLFDMGGQASTNTGVSPRQDGRL